MRSWMRIGSLVLALVLWGLGQHVRAQGGLSMGGIAMPSNMGTMASPSGQMFGVGDPAPQQVDPPLAVTRSFVSFIDGAAPRNVVGFRFDGAYNNRQPTRAEYLFTKGGLPNSRGFPLPETRVDSLEFTSYAEYAIIPWLSLFVEGPYRWINPEVNANQNGPGDMRYGLKVCTWSADNVIATFLLRVYQPTARQQTLGTNHWSVEPGLLAAYRLNDNILLEGEVRYWTALGGSDFAGDLVRYGLGISYGMRGDGFWYMPVAEAIGWTVLSGKTMLTNSPGNYFVEDARGQTIANGYLGLRLGYGQNLDFYLGYGRSFTGDFWARENYRFEFRFTY